MSYILFKQINEQFIPATNSCLACTCKSKQEGGLFCENLSMNCTEECGPDEELVYKNDSCCPTCENQRSGNSCKTTEKYKYIEVEDSKHGKCKSLEKVLTCLQYNKDSKHDIAPNLY